MKAKLKRSDELQDCERIVIYSGESEFRIREEHGELVVTKHDLSAENDRICVFPSGKNQIKIK